MIKHISFPSMGSLRLSRRQIMLATINPFLMGMVIP